LRALSAQLGVEKAQLKLQKESLKPDLNLKASYTAFGQSGSPDTLRCRSASDCHNIVAGVALTLPLDFSSVSEAHRAADARLQSLEHQIEYAQQMSIVEFNSFKQQEASLRIQAESVRTMIRSQKRRLDLERQRQQRGRASTFDVIKAENDLSESQQRLAEIQAQRLMTISQMRNFEVVE
jgi:outer membrane protein TolC